MVVQIVNLNVKYIVIVGYCCYNIVGVNLCVCVYGGFIVGYCQIKEELIGDVQKIYYFCYLLFIVFQMGDMWC